ncbi:MAG TPA: dihydroxy-acid dehydratase [Deltaproteobacteria bacterium]|nr:dihydroxy-acid dehydratase [Deltaproteobacteria bacterium]HCP44734.1 dihydroxy-acid dehydratase [Deltaproteobacteria bacterium]
MAPKKPLRSASWYGKADKDGFIHRSWMKSQGLPDDVFDGRPVVGICNTWSQLTPCNAHLRALAEHVARGIWEQGALPVEFPAMSLGETQMRPTAMLWRNLLAMEVEESIRGNPLDGVVLLGGCDKTTPGQVMGACSVGLPFIVVSSGPMLSGRHRGRPLGSGTDVWKLSEGLRAGDISEAEFNAAERCMSRSAGTCMTMGTASTMACIVEAMGLALPGNGTLPAVDGRRAELAHRSGRRIVDLIHEDLGPEALLTPAAFRNGIRAVAALGGSTNAVVHLLAIAGRIGVDLSLEDWTQVGRGVPTVVDLMPSGRFLMEDFDAAGGMPAVIDTLRGHFELEANTVDGRSLGAIADAAERFLVQPAGGGDGSGEHVIRDPAEALCEDGGLRVLHGNLAPDGAILKPSAASPELLSHTGPAVVFTSIEDFRARIDDPDLDVSAESILVLQGCGPRGYPGMAEVGNMGLPKRLLEAGVRDMVRISDARMSGTAFGTVVLHVAPEAAVGGPLALVQDGDTITLDAEAGRLELHVDDAELARRKAAWVAPAAPPSRGWARLYVDHVQQADRGCDLDFLVGKSGSDVPRESH